MGLRLVSSVTKLELSIEMKWSEVLLKCVAKLVNPAPCTHRKYALFLALETTLKYSMVVGSGSISTMSYLFCS